MTNVLRSRFARPLVFAVAAAVALGACGGDDDGAGGEESGGTTTTSVFPTIPPVTTAPAAPGATVPATLADGSPAPPSTVTPGQVTTPIPPSTTVAGATTVAGSPQAEFSYTVVAGDCWSCIANKLDVDYNDLLAVNGASADTLLTPGEKIKVPGQSSGGGDAASTTTAAGSGTATTTASGGATYTVVAGDCWVCIANKLGVDVDDLYAANGANADTLLVAGQKIKVPSGSSASTTAAATTTTTR